MGNIAGGPPRSGEALGNIQKIGKKAFDGVIDGRDADRPRSGS